VTAVLLAVVLWQLSRLAKSHALEIRPLLWTLTVAQVAITIIAYTNFFAAPAVGNTWPPRAWPWRPSPARSWRSVGEFEQNVDR
jgi:hypothetical protein